jgi:hypothetical protein
MGDHPAWCLLSRAAVRVTLDDCATEPIIDLRPLGEDAWIHLSPLPNPPDGVRQGKFAEFCAGARRALSGRIGLAFGDGTKWQRAA